MAKSNREIARWSDIQDLRAGRRSYGNGEVVALLQREAVLEDRLRKLVKSCKAGPTGTLALNIAQAEKALDE